MKYKFKQGDTLIPKPYYQGFRNLIVETYDRGFYVCKILNGKAYIPSKAIEENYELDKQKT